MPNIKSAKKRVKVSQTKRLQNQMVASQMKTAVKKFNEAISKNDLELAKQLLPVAVAKIDNAAHKHVIHKNAANHKKSQIARTLSQLEKGIIVVKIDAKALKQQEQKAAAARKAAEAEEIKKAINEAKKKKEAAKNPQPAKKGSKKEAIQNIDLSKPAVAPKAKKAKKADVE
ncbi:MAG: 30S ribosomal protein S20 [Clostridia bacterium]|nr:30S ribosomal protein S20 [Clostridia bacterium]